MALPAMKRKKNRRMLLTSFPKGIGFQKVNESTQFFGGNSAVMTHKNDMFIGLKDAFYLCNFWRL